MRREKVRRRLKKHRPLVAMGSPERTPFSTLRNLSRNRETPETRARKRKAYEEAVDHLEFMIGVYEYQAKDGKSVHA